MLSKKIQHLVTKTKLINPS